MGEKNKKDFSIIDKGLTVDGAVACRGRLIVKGEVRGTLEGETVIIAKEGAVYADTKVNRMTIGGQFEGNITVAEELIVLSTGKCSGRVVCRDLVVESGGVLNADISCAKTLSETPVETPAERFILSDD